MTVPHYPKVVAFGTLGTEDALNGAVRIDEKVDGSQFGFGVGDGGLVFRSRSAELYAESCQPMFRPALTHILSKQEILREKYGDGRTYFYAEVVTKNKHNVLSYAAVPKGYMVLFDAVRYPCVGNPTASSWFSVSELAEVAEALDIAFIPPLFQGEITQADLMELLNSLNNRVSALGGAQPEGLVIKNYAKTMYCGGRVWPIMVKMVRPQFKEKHASEWHGEGGKTPITALIDSFRRDEVRWQKAITHMQEAGQLEHSLRDIGKLCAYVQQDLMDEEKEGIKEKLWQIYGREFQRMSVAGLAEYYKGVLQTSADDAER